MAMDFFLKTAAADNAQEAAQELQVTLEDVFMVVSSAEEGVKFAAFTNAEAPDWDYVMVYVVFPKLQIENLRDSIRSFAKTCPGSEVIALAQANRSINLLYKGLDEVQVGQLVRIVEKYDR